jgi:hypothetical protein
MNADKDYTNVLLEQLRGQNKAVLEAVGYIQDSVKTLATQESLNELATTVNTIQSAVR